MLCYLPFQRKKKASCCLNKVLLLIIGTFSIQSNTLLPSPPSPPTLHPRITRKYLSVQCSCFRLSHFYSHKFKWKFYATKRLLICCDFHLIASEKLLEFGQWKKKKKEIQRNTTYIIFATKTFSSSYNHLWFYIVLWLTYCQLDIYVYMQDSHFFEFPFRCNFMLTCPLFLSFTYTT